MNYNIDFETYWTLMRPNLLFENRKEAARNEWDKYPEKQKPIIAWLQKRGAYPNRNPFFFIQDFKVQQVRQQTLTFREYYARFGTTLEQDGWRMTNPTGQQVIYVKEGC